MNRQLHVSLLALACIGLVVGGCAEGVDVLSEGAEIQTDCEKAADLLDTCFGEFRQPATCDEAQAAEIVGLSCDDLTLLMKDTKSDLGRSLADTGCNWGLYQFCRVPACNAEADEPVSELPPHDLENPSACAVHALQYEGCGACEYYTCREAEAQCGSEGYLLYYAHRYCNTFRLITEPNVSYEGQMWLRKIRRCLITSLDVLEPGTDCQSISDAGFGSHPECYVNTGFCALPIGDWVAVLATIDTLDFNFRESFITGNRCLRDWLSGGKF